MRTLMRASALALAVGLCLLASPSLADASKLRADLPRVLDEARAGELIPVSIVLGDQLEAHELRAAGQGFESPEARRAHLVALLKEHAARTQVRVRGFLEAAAERGEARRIRPLWIGNVIGVDLTRDEILRVASLDEVAWINWNPKVDISLDTKATAAPEPLSSARAWLESFAPADVGVDEIECGVDLMRAPEVWNDLGNTGEGAVVAVVDSGVCWTHSDIVNQVWVNPGEDLDGDGVVMDPDDENGVDDDGNGFVDDLVGWNFDAGSNRPNDTNSHGSHCAGTVAGDGTAGFQSGMAPDAQIMIVKVGLTFSDEVDVWNAMEYASENGADAISMSLGWPHSQNPDRATWRNNADAAIELGTAMVIAAGNEGSGNEPDNVRTPGDVPRVITVGATDCSDNIAGFSSRGPVTWQDVPEFGDYPYPPGLIKPDVSAPGVSTRSHNICEGYSNKSGTSMATPHVAGAVALMVANNPGLTHDDIKFLLEDTSIDLGDAGKDNVFGAGRVDAYEAVLSAATSDGRVSIKQSRSACVDVLDITVSDVDLEGTGFVDVTLTSDSEPGGEVVTLSETSASSGVFRGTIEVDDASPTPDGVLQVAHDDVIVATYIDADDGLGGINVEKSDTAVVDCVKPFISNVRSTDVGLSAATIRWTTDEVSDSVVLYGETTPPTLEERGAANVTEHSVRITRLEECTVYYYQVESADFVGNQAVDDNAGRYYYFETLGDFGDGPVSCQAGKMIIDEDLYSCADTVTFRLSDLGLNHDANELDTVVVNATSTSEAAPESVLMTETGPNTSTFEGSIPTGTGGPVSDGMLQVKDGDVITLTYSDEDDGTGRATFSFDTADVDCVAPIVKTLEVDTITDQRATVRITTDEVASAVIEYGETAALGRSKSNSSLLTSHSFMLNEFSDCQEAHFRIRLTDQFGYESVVDVQGNPYTFSLGEIPGLYWRDDFEDGAGEWELDGEWQVGAPEGLGGSSGRSDPDAAYNNAGVLGHDLSGLGAHGGDYEPDTSESAITRVLDGSSWQNAKLIFYRNLHSGAGDDARVRVWIGPGYTIWRSEENLVNDAGWSYQSYDLSGLADGQPAVQIEFMQNADLSGQYSGWTIDDVIVKDGTLPDYGACSTCSGAPSFAGVVSAHDNDACGAEGVTVSWDEAASWGTGASGTYAVYRGTTPDFTPSSSNLVAAGVAGLSHVDESAPEGVELYYLVRAESDENCASGPNNGGVLDANTVRVAVSNSSEQPNPGAIVDLDVELLNRAHVRLSWSGVANASSYAVYRSDTPEPGDEVLIGETGENFFDDLSAGSTAATYFYEVRAKNACGVEGD